MLPSKKLVGMLPHLRLTLGHGDAEICFLLPLSETIVIAEIAEIGVATVATVATVVTVTVTVEIVGVTVVIGVVIVVAVGICLGVATALLETRTAESKAVKIKAVDQSSCWPHQAKSVMDLLQLPTIPNPSRTPSAKQSLEMSSPRRMTRSLRVRKLLPSRPRLTKPQRTRLTIVFRLFPPKSKLPLN